MNDVNKVKELSENMGIDLLSDDLPFTDEMIIGFLQSNPEIFNRHPELLTSLRINDQQRGTVSLVERQQSQLRQKIHSLEEEITQLMSIANHNEQLFALYNDLYLRLLDCVSIEEILDSLHHTTTDLLSLADVKLWLTESYKGEHNSLITNDCTGVFQNRLTNEPFYFGRLQQSEQELIFSQSEIPVGSVVLIKLEHNQQEVGFLAISSQDAEHFDPRMDTLLLGQFRKLVAKLIVKQLTK